MRYVLLICVCLIYQTLISQEVYESIPHSKLLEFKIDEDIYEYGWFWDEKNKNRIPCFRDYTKNSLKMTLTSARSDSVIYESSEPEKNGLKIIPTKILIDKKNRKFEIKGRITGAWESVAAHEFKIFLGHRNDTISNITLGPSEYGPVFYDGKEITESTVVDVIPAFYLSDYENFSAFWGERNVENSERKEILFEIYSDIDAKSILVFGLSSRYAEIFEIGKLLE